MLNIQRHVVVALRMRNWIQTTMIRAREHLTIHTLPQNVNIAMIPGACSPRPAQSISPELPYGQPGQAQ